MLLQEDLTLSLLDKCKQSLSVIKGIAESTTDDEVTLFEALYLNDELQQVVSKYEELEASQRSGAQQTQNDDTAKHEAEAVQNPNELPENHKGDDEFEESEDAHVLDRKLPQKSDTLEVNATVADEDSHVETKIVDSTKEKNNATEVDEDCHVETKIVDSAKEKNGESSFKRNTE